jgi:cytidylate kinase
MDKPELPMREKPHVAIAISRQMGSGGSYLGYTAAKELRFKYIDREILRQASQRLHMGTAVLEEYEERSGGLLETILRGFSFGDPEMPYARGAKQPVYERDLFGIECTIMHEIVDRYDAVIVGRAGFHVLRERPGVIRVFVHAPLEFRINRVVQVQHSLVSEARAKVEASDQTRAKFVRDMTGVEWTDARNYDLCIDSSRVSFPTSVEMIIKLVDKKQHTRQEPPHVIGMN